MEGDLCLGSIQRRTANISIHTLRMEGDRRRSILPPDHDISIHTLRMEGDAPNDLYKLKRLAFQSTPSAWRVTLLPRFFGLVAAISIHTLRMEGDRGPRIHQYLGPNFNPHPPHGG